MPTLHLFTQHKCPHCHDVIARGIVNKLTRIPGYKFRMHSDDPRYADYGVVAFPSLVITWGRHTFEWPGCLPAPYERLALENVDQLAHDIASLTTPTKLAKLADAADISRMLFPPALTANIDSVMIAQFIFNAERILQLLPA